jgi:hypothetical protein
MGLSARKDVASWAPLGGRIALKSVTAGLGEAASICFGRRDSVLLMPDPPSAVVVRLFWTAPIVNL